MILSDSLFGDDSSSEVSTDGLPTISTSQQGTTAPVEHEKMYAVSDVMGKNYYKEKDKEFNGKMKLEVEYLAYSDKPKGTILSQNPPTRPASRREPSSKWSSARVRKR